MPKPTSIKDIIGNWMERQWNNEIFFLITKAEQNRISLNHLINQAEINQQAIFDITFDEFGQIHLKSEVDHYVVFNVNENFMQIDKLQGRDCFRFNLVKIG